MLELHRKQKWNTSLSVLTGRTLEVKNLSINTWPQLKTVNQSLETPKLLSNRLVTAFHMEPQEPSLRNFNLFILSFISTMSGTASKLRCPKALGPTSWRPRTTAMMGLRPFVSVANNKAKNSTPPSRDSLGAWQVGDEKHRSRWLCQLMASRVTGWRTLPKSGMMHLSSSFIQDLVEM